MNNFGSLRTSSQAPYLSRPCLDKSVHTGSRSLRCSSSPQNVCRTFRGPHNYVSPHPPIGHPLRSRRGPIGRSLRSGLYFLPHMPKVGAIINRPQKQNRNGDYQSPDGIHKIITGEYYSPLRGYHKRSVRKKSPLRWGAE